MVFNISVLLVVGFCFSWIEKPVVVMKSFDYWDNFETESKYTSQDSLETLQSNRDYNFWYEYFPFNISEWNSGKGEKETCYEWHESHGFSIDGKTIYQTCQVWSTANTRLIQYKYPKGIFSVDQVSKNISCASVQGVIYKGKEYVSCLSSNQLRSASREKNSLRLYLIDLDEKERKIIVPELLFFNVPEYDNTRDERLQSLFIQESNDLVIFWVPDKDGPTGEVHKEINLEFVNLKTLQVHSYFKIKLEPTVIDRVGQLLMMNYEKKEEHDELEIYFTTFCQDYNDCRQYGKPLPYGYIRSLTFIKEKDEWNLKFEEPKEIKSYKSISGKIDSMSKCKVEDPITKKKRELFLYNEAPGKNKGSRMNEQRIMAYWLDSPEEESWEEMDLSQTRALLSFVVCFE